MGNSKPTVFKEDGYWTAQLDHGPWEESMDFTTWDQAWEHAEWLWWCNIAARR